MSSSEEHKKLAAAFSRAEKRMKDMEALAGQTPFPSINELRYAGYHLVQSLCGNDPDEIRENLEKAHKHCRRSYYDASEFGLIVLLEQVRGFRDEHGNNPFTVQLVPEYGAILVKFELAQTEISKVRANSETRDLFYEACDQHLKDIKEIAHKLNVIKPIVANRKREDERKERRDSQRFWLALVVAIAALLWATPQFAHWLEHLGDKKMMDSENRVGPKPTN